MNTRTLLGLWGLNPGIFLLLSGTYGTAGAACGPGDHWVDTCAAGTDTFESKAVVGIDFPPYDTHTPPIPDSTVTLIDTATMVARASPTGTPDAPTHLNRIATSITSLNATNGTYTLHAGTSYGLPSLGAIREKTGADPSIEPTDPDKGYVTKTNLSPVDAKLAFSYFNVFFELVTPSGVLHNANALKLQTVIDETPPVGFQYTHTTFTPVDLLDASNNVVARLVSASHSPCGGSGDCTPPVSSVSITPGSPTRATITVRDNTLGSGDTSVSGLNTINAWGNNVALTIPNFTPGTTDPQDVIAEKVTETPATVSVRATDVAGNTSLADPTVTTLTVTNHGPVKQTFREVPQEERFVTVQNVGSGIRVLDIKVNDQKIRVAGLAEDEIRVINLGSALTAGDNTVTLIGYGLPGASATIAIGDGSLVPPPQGISKTLTIGARGHSAATHFSDVAPQQSLLSVYNGSPGLARLLVNVNGLRFKYVALGKNEVMRTIDMSSVMNSMEDNVIDLIGYGQAGASAVVSIPSYGNASE